MKTSSNDDLFSGYVSESAGLPSSWVKTTRKVPMKIPQALGNGDESIFGLDYCLND